MSWSYKWLQHRVKDTEITDKPHYAVMVFTDRRFSEAGYDRGDPPTSTIVRQMDYYAFEDKATWERMVEDIYAEKHKTTGLGFDTSNENVVLMHVDRRFKVRVTIDVGVSGT